MERFAIKIDKNLRANLYKICRLCGIDNPDKVKVLDDEITVNLDDGEPELWKKVLDCIGLLITKDDKMPQFMCTLCVDKINDFFEFREMCYATDVQTRKLLGIREEPKAKVQPRAAIPTVSYKTEDQDIKQPLSAVPGQRAGRKRRNADMEVCNTSKQFKTDDFDDVKPTATNTSAYALASKKKRFKLDNLETDTKPMFDTNPELIPKPGPASRTGCNSKLGLAKKRLKIESTAKEKKDIKPAKISKLMKNKLKVELAPQTEDRKPLSLQMQKKKKALELLKQRKLAKKVAVVKVEKLRKDSVEGKIKEEVQGTAPLNAPTQPKVKLKDKCTICSECFVNKALLDKHIKSTHIPTVARYHCVQCNETLKKNMEIKNHNLWHKLSKTPFQCGNCSETSCSIYTYSKHIRDCGQVAYLDANIPDWHCPECRGVFETTYLFNIHSCVSNTLVCPGCDRSHKWKEDYYKHIPTCAAAFRRIPSYMSSNIQVKNEAELPSSPIPQLHTHPLPSAASIAAVQATAQSRITPPLMDSNQCVVIPGNVSLLEESSSPSSKSSGKKSNRITKKDLKRFDKLLKSTMTTLVSIKQEPAQGEAVIDGEPSVSSDVRNSSESPPESPAYGDDHFYNNDDDDDSANEEAFAQPVGTIKQEIIDEGYRDLYNNIEVNIKREIVVNEHRNPESSTAKKKACDAPDVAKPVESSTPKPVLKLKITKEHGTLNSVLLGSPKSEKKKKKKKRKEEKHKKEAAEAVYEVEQQVAQVPESVEVEPAMPLPEILRIKEEVPEPEEAEGVEEQASSQSSHSTPSIVAATGGSLQISCVSEGVHFNGAEDNDDEEREHPSEPVQPLETEQGDGCTENTPVSLEEPPQEEIDVKPRLEDLIPTLQISSVQSGEDLLKKPMKSPAKKKRRQVASSSKPSTSTPKIVSVSSGSQAVAYQLELEKHVDEGEDSFEKVDNNENIFDYSQVRIKEEVPDPSYGEHHDDEVPAEGDDAREETDDKNAGAETTEKESDESAYIANIDFNNVTIKQEKEYIDDGLDAAAAAGLQDDEDSSGSDSESSSSSSSEDNDSDSEREYRDLPLVGDEVDALTPPAPIAEPLIQISEVRSEFTYHQEDNKTESVIGAESGSENKSTTECVGQGGSSGLNPQQDLEPPKTVDPSGNSDKPSAILEGEFSGALEGVQAHMSDSEFQPEHSAMDTSASPLSLRSLAELPTCGSSASADQPSTSAAGLDKDQCSTATKTACGDSEKPTTIAGPSPTELKLSEGGFDANQPSTSALADAGQVPPAISPIPRDLGPTEPVESSVLDLGLSMLGLEKMDHIPAEGVESNSSGFPAESPSNPTTSDATTSAVSSGTINSTNSNNKLLDGDIDSCTSSSAKQNVNRTEEQDSYSALISDVFSTRTACSTESVPGSDVISKLMANVSSTLTQPESTAINTELNASTIALENQHLSPSAGQDGDSITNVVEPLINEANKSTVVTCSPAPSVLHADETVPALLNFPVTSHSPTNITTQHIADLASADTDSELMSFQATSCNAHDTSPSLNLSFLSAETSAPVSVESVIDSQLPSTLGRTSRHSTEDEKSAKLEAKDELRQFSSTEEAECDLTEIEQQPALDHIEQQFEFPDPSKNSNLLHSAATLESQPSTSAVAGAESTSTIPSTDDISVSIDLSDILSNSTLQGPMAVLSSEPNTQEISQTEANIPTFSTGLQRFTSTSSYVEANLNFTELCSNTPSLTELQDELSTSTAGQLQTLIASTDMHSTLGSGLSAAMSSTSLANDPDLSVPILSEEVQNLLNEDTVAANNFELNDSILRARCSSSVNVSYSPAAPVAVSVPNFTDLENVNEIAENNNNANIERELQDELGNALAAAIADRSSNDEVDENNVINENRANFDIT